MPIQSFFIRQVVVLRAPDNPDRYGAGQRDWRIPVTAWTGLGWLSPESSQSEDNVNREESRGSMWLYLPVGADILNSDRVTVDGRLFQVTGNAAQCFTPSGEHHLEVRVESVTG
jgi:hypothetical protein